MKQDEADARSVQGFNRWSQIVKMQKHHLSKEKSTSHRSHEPQEGETEALDRYDMKDVNVDRTTRKPKAKNVPKDDNQTNSRHDETALNRFKRKFLRKSSKATDNQESLRSPETRQRDLVGGSSPSLPQNDHVYEVPFSNSGVEDDREEDHIYENGNVWAVNNVPRENLFGFQNHGGLQKGNKLQENGAVGGKGRYQIDTQINNDMHNRCRVKERWQQGKSMSLPASRVSSKSSSQFPLRLRSASGSVQRELFCGSSTGGSVNEDVAEAFPVNTKNGNVYFIRSQSLPAPSKLSISHHFLAGLNDLCKCGWYWGPLNSKEAEAKLHGKPDGTFLVRDSNDNRYLLSLSFRSESVTLHTRIEFCKGKFSFYAAPFISSGSHESIVELIEDCVKKSKERVFCYSKGRGRDGAAFPVRLMKGLSRFEHVCTLQHLCRFVIRQHFTLENIGDMPLPGMMKRYLGKNHFDAKQG